MKYDEAEVLRMAKISAANLVRTADVFKVITFYPDKQTVDVEACVKPYQRDMGGEIRKDMYGDYTRMSQDQDTVILLNIPVQQFRCGQFSITAPLQAGDTGVVIFLKNDIENWKVEGGVTGTYHVYPYDINSCVFSPFVPNESNKDLNFNANYLEIKSKSAIIRVKEDSIEVTASGGTNVTSNVSITGDLSVSGNVTAEGNVTGADCLAGTVSLKSHIHNVTGAVPAAPPAPVVTEAPTP